MLISTRNLVGFASIGVSALLCGQAGAASIPLPVSGWNQDIVVEASGPGLGMDNSSLITASMDNGTAKTGGVWYEAGLTGSGGGGLPTAGVAFPSAFDATTTLLFQSYTANNALLLTTGTSGNLTLNTPTKLTSLALFGSTGNAGNGPNTDTVTVHFSDGTADFTAPVLSNITHDWFGGAQTAYNANGRLGNVQTGAFDNVGNGNPQIYQDTIDLSSVSSHPVSGVTIAYTGPGNNAIMAISGAPAVATPEPTTISLLGLGAFGLLARRRRNV